jgi:hypothetical protein
MFGGSYRGGASRPVPDAPWLARGWLRSWIANVGPRSAKMVQDPATWEIPLVKRAFLRSIADRVLLLWERAPRLLDALDSLPATLCHQDAWRTNFIASRDARGRECTVLLDWAVVGLGPIGLDLGIFLTGNHFWLHADPAEIAEFDRETFAAYLEGIAASGCRIERRTARFAYVAAAALWGGLTAPVLFPQWGDPTRREWLEAKFRRSLDDAVAPSARVLEYMLDLGDEAWAFLEARY